MLKIFKKCYIKIMKAIDRKLTEELNSQWTKRQIKTFKKVYGDFGIVIKRQPRKKHATPGNKYAVKLKSSEIRQEAYRQYCEHIASGRPKKEWKFKHKHLSCTQETMEKYLRDQSEFDPIHKECAEAESAATPIGKEIVDDSALGKNDFDVPTLRAIMRNKFCWV